MVVDVLGEWACLALYFVLEGPQTHRVAGNAISGGQVNDLSIVMF